MKERSVEADDRALSAHFRTLAKKGDWHSFVTALSPDHADSVKFVSRNQLRSALLSLSVDDATKIIATLTPEALLALEVPVEKVRSFAEAMMRGRDIDQLKSLLANTAEIAPDDASIAGLQISLFGRLGKRSAIRQAMRNRPVAFANPHVLLLASDHTDLQSEEHKQVVAHLENLPWDSENRVRLKAVRWLYRTGETERAETMARRFRGNAEFSEFDGIVNIMTNLPACEPRLKPSHAYPEIMVGHNEGDRAVLINFNGFAKQNIAKGNARIVERYSADLGLTLVSVNDPTNLLCLGGIPGVAGTIKESAAILSSIVSDLGIDKVYTMGGSSGGFGAVVYGLEMKADGAIIFGSPTECGPANSHIDTRSQVVARKLRNTFDSRTLDMVAWLDDAEHQLPITIYHGADNEIDSWHAGRIADRPNVRVIALEEVSSHHAMVESVRGRTLSDVLADGLSLPPR